MFMVVSNASGRAVCCSVGVAAMLARVLIGLPAQAAQTVQQVPGAAGHTVWQIIQPTVNKPSTDYPQIAFSPGKRVTVTATGCVQTGGKGHTWKRYVDPAGDNSATFYHGRISIPGATSGLVDFDPRTPTAYTIPANTSVPASQMHLQLGYADNVYGDNGYSNRNSDNGNMDQCWGLGDASVIIDISPLPPPVQAPAEADYTLTINSIMIRNPRTHHFGEDGTDTDVLGAGVIVNGTQSAVAGQTVGNVKRGSHSANFPITITQVRPGDRLNFLYTVVNAGNPSSQATTTEVTGIISKIATVVPVAGSALSAVATGAGGVINLVNPDCDGPVAAGAIMGTGSDLALWTQTGPYTRTLGFAGVKSATGCGSNSFYEINYTIARSNAGPQPFSLQVNARSAVSQLGTKTRSFARKF